MVYTLRVADLVVEESRQDEADGRRPGRPHVGKHSIQTRHVDGREVAQDQDDRGDQGEAEFGHGHYGGAVAVESSARSTARRQEGLVAGAGWGVDVLRARRAARSPAQDSVDGGAAGV